MATTFELLRRFYDNNQFAELLQNPNGIFWLKLRSVSRSSQLEQLCQRAGINCEGIRGRQLLAHVYDSKPDEHIVDEFIRERYEAERVARRENEDYLVSQLYQMKVFD